MKNKSSHDNKPKIKGLKCNNFIIKDNYYKQPNAKSWCEGTPQNQKVVVAFFGRGIINFLLAYATSTCWKMHGFSCRHSTQDQPWLTNSCGPLPLCLPFVSFPTSNLCPRRSLINKKLQNSCLDQWEACMHVNKKMLQIVFLEVSILIKIKKKLLKP